MAYSVVFSNPPGNIPAQVPSDPYYISNQPFDAVVSAFGVNTLWEKAHACPCTWQGWPNTRGSPIPSCITCSGLGWYWDTPVGPFSALLTYSHSPLAADEPGFIMDEKFGALVGASPLLTLSYGCQPTVWEKAGEFDRWTEIDAYWKYNSVLIAGQKTLLPYTSGVTIAPTGAVTIWNTSTSAVTVVSSYVVSGNSVIVSGLPYGTTYMVDYVANPQYVSVKRAGAFPHVRPFVQGTIPLPKRMRLVMADVWMRTQGNY